MAHLSYNEFKNRFGDLGITKYTKAMWLESGCEEIGVIKGSIFTFKEQAAKRIYTANASDFTNKGLRTDNGLYSQNLEVISDGRAYTAIVDFSIYATGNGYEGSNIGIALPNSWTDAQCLAYLKDKVILYKKKDA